MARFLGIEDEPNNINYEDYEKYEHWTKCNSWTQLKKFLDETLGHDPRFVATVEETTPSCSIVRINFNGKYVFSLSYIISSVRNDLVTTVVSVFLNMAELGHCEDEFEYKIYSVGKSSKYLYIGPPNEAQIFLLKYSLELYQ